MPKDYNPFTHSNPHIIFFNHSVRCFLNPFPYVKNHLLISPLREFERPCEMSPRFLSNYLNAIIGFGRYMIQELGDAYGIIRIKTDNKSIKQTHFHILPELPKTSFPIMFFNNVLNDQVLEDEMRILQSGMIIVRFGISGVKFMTYKNDSWLNIERDPNPDLETPFILKLKEKPPKIREFKLIP